MKVRKVFMKKSKTECVIIYTDKENFLIVPSGSKIHIFGFKKFDEMYEAIVNKTLEVDFYKNVYGVEEDEDENRDDVI